MNYMQMVSFVETSSSEVLSKFIYKRNEEYSELDKPILVPSYLVLEAIFQTAGKVAREYSNNKCGGSIVSFSGFTLVRPVFSNELINIKARLISFNEARRCFFLDVSVYAGQEVIVHNGQVLIMQDEAIKSQFLNNTDAVDVDNYLEKIVFGQIGG